MKRDVVELDERFQQLKSSCAALSEKLRETALALRTSGNIPSPELDHSIGNYRELLGHFRSELGITTSDTEQARGSTWEQFQNRLHVCHQAAEALHRLQAVERLSVQSGFEATLEPVRNECREVTSRLANAPWEESDLLSEVGTGRHPLCRLVSLVEGLRGLNDDDWATEMAATQQAFGIAVSTAIARGKVALTADSAGY